MAGDIDLFKSGDSSIEINFMIAESASRRKGLA